MKIVIDARESGTTTGRYIDKLVEHLYLLQPKYEIVVLAKSSRLKSLKKLAPAFKIVKSDFPEFGFAEQLGFAWQLFRLRADLVHFCMPQQPILYFKKSVSNVHDLTTIRFRNPAKNFIIFTIKQWIYRLVILWAAHKSRFVLAISNYTKRDLVKFAHINPAKVVVTHLSADKITDESREVPGIKPGNFIMYVGRPLPHKNLQRLIEAFVKLQSEHGNLQLVLTGKKDVLYQRFEKHILQNDIENVIFTDFVTEGQLRWLYENTAAYIFPSLSEGFGLPGLEAMAHGAPVVSSHTASLPEIYDNAAHYFDPTDASDMAAKINQVLGNEELRKNLIEKGHRQVKKYSWRRMAEQTLEVYNKALNT